MIPELHPESTLSIHIELTDRFDAGSPKREWAEIRQPQEGDLIGATAFVRLAIIDGELCVTAQGMDLAAPLPLRTAGARARRSLRLSGVEVMVEHLAPKLGEMGLPWLQAVTSTRRRPGRAKRAELEWALLARERVEAEERAPRGAGVYMKKTCLNAAGQPRFKNTNAVSAAVNKAKEAGMLERVDGRWVLTEHAIETLRNKQEESQ